jgi:hypothetical protein
LHPNKAKALLAISLTPDGAAHEITRRATTGGVERERELLPELLISKIYSNI